MATTFVIYSGPLTLDLNSLNGKLVDVEDGGTRGFRSDLPGFQGVVLELAQGVPTMGASAGIPQDVYEHFVMCNDTVTTIQQNLAIARKQVEVLEESLAYYVDARQNDIAMIVDAIRSRARRRKDNTVLLSFEKTIKYNGQIGDKAFRTRRQNEKNAAPVVEDNGTPANGASESPALPA